MGTSLVFRKVMDVVADRYNEAMDLETRLADMNKNNWKLGFGYGGKDQQQVWGVVNRLVQEYGDLTLSEAFVRDGTDESEKKATLRALKTLSRNGGGAATTVGT